ncbi:MAG: hypothetical protein AAF720_01450 [Pseudomonadota bacterium]
MKISRLTIATLSTVLLSSCASTERSTADGRDKGGKTQSASIGEVDDCSISPSDVWRLGDIWAVKRKGGANSFDNIVVVDDLQSSVSPDRFVGADIDARAKNAIKVSTAQGPALLDFLKINASDGDKKGFTWSWTIEYVSAPGATLHILSLDDIQNKPAKNGESVKDYLLANFDSFAEDIKPPYYVVNAVKREKKIHRKIVLDSDRGVGVEVDTKIVAAKLRALGEASATATNDTTIEIMRELDTPIPTCVGFLKIDKKRGRSGVELEISDFVPSDSEPLPSPE